MTTRPIRWGEKLAAMPSLTEAQLGSIKEVLDYRFAYIVGDYHPCDEALCAAQDDLDSMSEGARGKPPESPALWQDLKPGDWFTFDPMRGAEPWIMLDTALQGAVHVRTGRVQFFGRMDDTQLWRTQAHPV